MKRGFVILMLQSGTVLNSRTGFKFDESYALRGLYFEDYTCLAALRKLSLCIDFNGKAWPKIFDRFLAITFLFLNQFLKFLRGRASVLKFFPKKLTLRKLDENKNLLSRTY